MVASNQLLYKPGEKPDHVVVIKYVPYVGELVANEFAAECTEFCAPRVRIIKIELEILSYIKYSIDLNNHLISRIHSSWAQGSEVLLLKVQKSNFLRLRSSTDF